MNHGDENLLETLLDVTQKILTAEQLQDALDAIARAVSTLFAFRFVSIVAADSPDQDMTRRVMLGWNEETKAKRIGESISRSAARDFLAAEFEVYPNCYYFPAERFIEWKHIIYAGAGKNDEARSTPDSWHQNDSIALVLADHLGAMLGYISIDAPEDGLVPERTTLKRMRLFADLVGLALANARARAAEEARARLLEDQARTQSDFLGVVSHEFRSPLAAIRGAATLLETSAERLPEIRRRELLQTIAASTVRMSTLFDDFLLLSRVDAGSLRLVEEIVDPQVVVDESLGRLRSEHPA
ncbi:MAG TPA: histidine kinase dimerization/phospho-acceptor domain-containing protein, partial [Candidatus Dormibacteraeota bacterium]|nr:histidine kinase dimerization/phospho-acceptor domain-containing protein [Candidatus Dormibacteraeota bacterium]